MFGNLKMIIIAAVALFIGYSLFFGSGSGPQSADLGQVLDRSVFALDQYSDHLKKNNVTEPTDEDMNKLTGYMSKVMNSNPRFHEENLGVALKEDATFQGYTDTNGNGIKDDGEESVFTVEVDSENKRLIATDNAGQGSHMGFSGTGFLAGALIGSLLSRQSRAGIQPGAFSSRQTTARSAYKAPSSARSRARSGGLGKGK